MGSRSKATVTTDEAPASEVAAEPRTEDGRAYDENGNVRPADARYLPKGDE